MTYVDPGSGSMVIQIIVASIAGAGLLFYKKIVALLAKFRGKGK
jgi:hypothetical protein